MPVVRVTRQVGTAPLPGARKTAHETFLSTGVSLEQAKAGTAAAAAELAGGLARMGASKYGELQQLERDRADEIAVLNAQNRLSSWEQQRLYDPDQGALAQHGRDAFALPETVSQEFTKLANEVEATLTTPRQKQQFARVRLQRHAGLDITLRRHVFTEMQRYEGEEMKAGVDLRTSSAIANANDPRRVSEDLTGAVDMIRRHGPRAGLGREAIAAAVEGVQTAVHVGVVERLLAQGQDRKAQVYYEETKDQISGTALPALERALDSASTAATGLRVADAIWLQFGPKTDEDAIQLDRMEDAARAKFADDPKVLDATIRYLRERKAGIDASRQDRTEAIAGGLWRAASAGASLEQIRRMPEYIDAPGRVQAQVADYIVNHAAAEASRAYSEEGRALTRAQRVQDEKEGRGWARYWELANPTTLSRLSANAIEAKRGELGDVLTNKLQELKRSKLDTEDKVRGATLDDQLFKSMADSAGLQPYQTTQSDQKKAQLGYLRNAVESAIDREQTARKRELTRDEKAGLMKSEIDRQVMVDRWGGGRRPAAMVVNEQDREAAYVPLKEIPARNVDETVNLIRSEFPRDQRASRDEIVRRYRDRIQRAYAAKVLGLGLEEERRRLLGR